MSDWWLRFLAAPQALKELLDVVQSITKCVAVLPPLRYEESAVGFPSSARHVQRLRCDPLEKREDGPTAADEPKDSRKLRPLRRICGPRPHANGSFCASIPSEEGRKFSQCGMEGGPIVIEKEPEHDEVPRKSQYQAVVEGEDKALFPSSVRGVLGFPHAIRHALCETQNAGEVAIRKIPYGHRTVADYNRQ